MIKKWRNKRSEEEEEQGKMNRSRGAGRREKQRGETSREGGETARKLKRAKNLWTRGVQYTKEKKKVKNTRP